MNTPNAQNALLEAALEYADRGWPVLPIEPKGKAPAGKLVPHGVKQATTDERTIRYWWRRLTTANVGLATGVAFDALDLDGNDGITAFADAAPFAAYAANGPTVCTGGGGRHVYVAPTGRGNRTNVLPHVDWRGLGGYVVAPPSIHYTGVRYRWRLSETDPCSGMDVPIYQAPAWVLELLDGRSTLVPRPMRYNQMLWMLDLTEAATYPPS